MSTPKLTQKYTEAYLGGRTSIHPSTFSMFESCSQLRLLSSRLHSEEGLLAFAQEFVLCSRYLEVCLGVKEELLGNF